MLQAQLLQLLGRKAAARVRNKRVRINNSSLRSRSFAASTSKCFYSPANTSPSNPLLTRNMPTTRTFRPIFRVNQAELAIWTHLVSTQEVWTQIACKCLRRAALGTRTQIATTIQIRCSISPTTTMWSMMTNFRRRKTFCARYSSKSVRRRMKRGGLEEEINLSAYLVASKGPLWDNTELEDPQPWEMLEPKLCVQTRTIRIRICELLTTSLPNSCSLKTLLIEQSRYQVPKAS